MRHAPTSSLALVASALLFTTGCIEMRTLVTLRKDGSGMVSETILLSPSLCTLAARMQADKGLSTPSLAATLMDPTQYAQRAEAMGKGVAFVSIEPREDDHGISGVRVLYAFNDIEDLLFGSRPAPAASEDDDISPTKPIRFDFSGGRRARLRIRLPETPSLLLLDSPATSTDDEPYPTDTKAIADLLSGFRFLFQIRVEGDIYESSATFADTAEYDPAGATNTITLVDVDANAVLQNETDAQGILALLAVRDIPGVTTALLANPNVRIEAQDDVSVRFR